jgi:hypothetical protein
MKRICSRGIRLLVLLPAALACLALAPAGASASEGSPWEWFGGQSFLATLTTQSIVGSTKPPNGDLNPYGIVNVARSEGSLVAGDTLVSNFNNSENLQGTGSTIVQLSPGGELSVFAQIEASKLPGPCPGGVGLTTALGILPGGFVVVGSLPSTNGQPATTSPGCLIVLDNTGHPVETISGPPINGPWDMATVPDGQGSSTLYVTNVLNGTVAAEGATVHGGTLVRIDLDSGPHGPVVTSERVVARGFPERTDPIGFIRGPTGVAVHRLPFGLGNIIFVADTAGNRVALVIEVFGMVFGAYEGFTISQGGELMEPLGLTLAPNGHILTTNAGNGNIVETTLSGKQFTYNTQVPAFELFGLTLSPDGHGILFVNDSANNVELAH